MGLSWFWRKVLFDTAVVSKISIWLLFRPVSTYMICSNIVRIPLIFILYDEDFIFWGIQWAVLGLNRPTKSVGSIFSDPSMLQPLYCLQYYNSMKASKFKKYSAKRQKDRKKIAPSDFILTDCKRSRLE